MKKGPAMRGEGGERGEREGEREKRGRMAFPLKRMYPTSHEFFEHGNLCRGFWKQQARNKQQQQQQQQFQEEVIEEFCFILHFPFFPPVYSLNSSLPPLPTPFFFFFPHPSSFLQIINKKTHLPKLWVSLFFFKLERP